MHYNQTTQKTNKHLSCFRLSHKSCLMPFMLRRFMYSRFGEADSMVVPYHPAVLLAWGAHVNVQVVTDTAWSYYLLKYAAKEQLPALLKLDGKALQALGLDGISKQHAELAAASIMSRPVCPCEAALLATGVPLVSSDMEVTYVDTRPPAMRTCRINPCQGSYAVGASAVTTYTARPHGTHDDVDFDAITLPRYFELFEVRGKRGIEGGSRVHLQYLQCFQDA
jgi:hypothetical protein